MLAGGFVKIQDHPDEQKTALGIVGISKMIQWFHWSGEMLYPNWLVGLVIAYCCLLHPLHVFPPGDGRGTAGKTAGNQGGVGRLVCNRLVVVCLVFWRKFGNTSPCWQLVGWRKTSLVFRCRDCLGTGTGWTGMGRMNGSGHLRAACLDPLSWQPLLGCIDL